MRRPLFSQTSYVDAETQVVGPGNTPRHGAVTGPVPIQPNLLLYEQTFNVAGDGTVPWRFSQSAPLCQQTQAPPWRTERRMLLLSIKCNILIFISECSLEYALETASLHPAKALGLDHQKGNLDFGCDADFVVLRPDTLQVVSTWIAGECVYKL